MGRWEDNAVERLQAAAMELYTGRGYGNVTVADIAERAGLTRRTFFRYFADKREVLFSGAVELQAYVFDSILLGTPGTPALAAVAAAVAGVARHADEDAAFADFARRRHALIRAHVELRERELSKLASLASSCADALRRRGCGEPAASLAAEAGIAAFKVGFERWVDDPKRGKMVDHVREAMIGLGSLVLERA